MRRKPRPNARYITLPEIEAHDGLPYHTVYRMVRRGLLPHVSNDLVGNTVVMRRADLEQRLDDHTKAVRS